MNYGIVFEQSEAAIAQVIDEFRVVYGRFPDVLVVPIPIISEAKKDANVEIVCGIPVAICQLQPPGQILATDTQTYCNLKQAEKEMGLLNEH